MELIAAHKTTEPAHPPRQTAVRPPLRLALTDMRWDFWLEQQLAPDGVACRLMLAVRVESLLDVTALNKALRILVKFHAALRRRRENNNA